MPVKINGKTLMECTESDLQVIIDNPDYRENEYIDYKQNFSFLEIDKGKEKNFQPKILYSAKLSFRFEEKIKSFSNKQKPK